MPQTGSKTLDQLAGQFKAGYKLERTGGGHYRVRDRHGNFVETPDGKVLSLTGTAHGGRQANNMRAQLKSAGVLKGTETRRRKPTRGFTDEDRRKGRESLALRARNRQEVVDKLHDRLMEALKPVGGVGQRGAVADLGLIGSLLTRQNGSTPITPDLVSASATRVIHRQWVDAKYQEIWNKLAERLESAEDVHEEWFGLVRQARGLPDEALVEVGKPVEGDWPFRVELLPIEAFVVDHGYQRPVSWPFVRSHAARFDESLVGTIDVSERRKGAVFAILDGQSRFEMCRLVGKKTIWASIYSGLDLASEARFFLHKNRDKKAIHPYYTFRARIAAQDSDAMEIEKIVKRNGYVISLTSANEKTPNAISAISAVQEAFERTGEMGESLTPTLEVLRESTLGQPHGQGHILIRGVAILFQKYEQRIDRDRLKKVLLQQSPELLQSRARENGRRTTGNAAQAMSRLLIDEYNRGIRVKTEKLG
jgi:hypothetical protein